MAAIRDRGVPGARQVSMLNLQATRSPQPRLTQVEPVAVLVIPHSPSACGGEKRMPDSMQHCNEAVACLASLNPGTKVLLSGA